jgi:hypothetical protein
MKIYYLVGSNNATNINNANVDSLTITAVINNSTGSAVTYKLRGASPNGTNAVTATNFAVRKIEF